MNLFFSLGETKRQCYVVAVIRLGGTRLNENLLSHCSHYIGIGYD
jgi:hypothetical protein